MNPEKSGRKGGLATRDNHAILCPTCGKPWKNPFHEEIGKKGGETTAQRAGRNGSPSMSERGHLGGRGNTREKANPAEAISPLGRGGIQNRRQGLSYH